MSETEGNAKEYLELLREPLKNLRIAFSEVVNEHKNSSKLVEAVRRLDNARQLINSTSNIGLVIGIGRYIIIPFPLTGDPKRDVGQTPVDLPEN